MKQESYNVTQYYTFEPSTKQPRGVFKTFQRTPAPVTDATVDKWIKTCKEVMDILNLVDGYGGYSTILNSAIHITTLLVLCNATIEDVFRVMKYDVMGILRFKCVYEDSGNSWCIGENIKSGNKEFVKNMLSNLELRHESMPHTIGDSKDLYLHMYFPYENKTKEDNK